VTDFLVFRLYGPLAAWGDVAVGEQRPSLASPSKSAVLGLVAASLGLVRSDEASLESLHRGFHVASRVDDPGELLVDYHSIETPFERAIQAQPAATRKDELKAGAAGGAKTNLSRREYRQDGLSAVALWRADGGDARWSLEELAGALRCPRFTPYLGRKSCPPALPFEPVVVRAAHPVEALRRAAFKGDAFLEKVERPRQRQYRWEASGPDALAQQTVRRRDQALGRKAWLFADREEHVRVEDVPAPPKGESHVPESH